MLQLLLRLKTLKLSKRAKGLASKALNCLPKNLKSYRYEVGLEYADGGIDFRQIFASLDENVVEMSYSQRLDGY